jgi:hypothetical protein
VGPSGVGSWLEVRLDGGHGAVPDGLLASHAIAVDWAIIW